MRKHSRQSIRLASSVSAFSLVELVVVIGIVLILAAILLLTLKHAKSNAALTGCMANQRKIHVALQLFMDDHLDWLPPGSDDAAPKTTIGDDDRDVGQPYGFWHNQKCGYNQSQTNYLIYSLATYLGYAKPDTTTRLAKAMLCPGFENLGRKADSNTVSYYLNGLTTDDTNALNLGFFPFGYPTAVSGYSTIDLQPHKISQVQAKGSLSQIWYLSDADTLAVAATGADNLALTPVHESIRVHLYFDGHIGTVKVNPAGGFSAR